jgi:hypothetical protein
MRLSTVLSAMPPASAAGKRAASMPAASANAKASPIST